MMLRMEVKPGDGGGGAGVDLEVWKSRLTFPGEAANGSSVVIWWLRV